MSLDPSPLSPTPTPLLSPTDPVPGRGAAAMGAGISLVLAIVVVFVTLRFGTQLLYLPQGLKAHASAWTITRPFQIQGFNYQWARSYSSSSDVGYSSGPTNQKIFTSEANDYHMNLVVITVTADQGNDSTTAISFGAGADDGYGDDVYKSAANAASLVHLTPVFKLAIRVNGLSDTSPSHIGSQWNRSDLKTIGTEENWFNSYTAFVTHYAQLAQSLNMPFLIIGDELKYLTVDTPDTLQTTPGPGDNITCKGRRDCEWRHVIDAIRNPSYQTYNTNTPNQGGGYIGKLIYAATSDTGAVQPEWQTITWWDAIDYIGIDAFFPLSDGGDANSNCIQDAWSGLAAHCGGALAKQNQGDVFDEMAKLSGKFARPIIFTGVGYESVSGSNGSPGKAYSNDTYQPDQPEQANDMQGLLDTFQSQPWWLGVIWSYDFAVWPRANLANVVASGGTAASPFALDLSDPDANWAFNTEWAGSCLTATANGKCADGNPPAKAAGLLLNTTYQIKPIPPLAQIG